MEKKKIVELNDVFSDVVDFPSSQTLLTHVYISTVP